MWKRLVIVACLLGAGPAEACALLQRFEMSSIGGADLVVVGRVTEYQDLGTLPGAALVTVAVEEALKGEAEGTITFVWNSGMAQGPHPSRAKGRILIGAKKGGRIVVSDLVTDMRPDLPSIIQPYCGEVWMLPATVRTVSEAREALE